MGAQSLSTQLGMGRFRGKHPEAAAGKIDGNPSQCRYEFSGKQRPVPNVPAEKEQKKRHRKRQHIYDKKTQKLSNACFSFYLKRPNPVPYIAVDHAGRIRAYLCQQRGNAKRGKKKKDNKVHERISGSDKAKAP
jgi:hypothetical protein